MTDDEEILPYDADAPFDDLVDPERRKKGRPGAKGDGAAARIRAARERISERPKRRVDRAPSVKRRGPRSTGGGGLPVAIVFAGITVLITIILSVPRVGDFDFSRTAVWLLFFTVIAFFDISLKGGGRLSMAVAPIFGMLVALPVDLGLKPPILYKEMSGVGCLEAIWVCIIGFLVVLVFDTAEHTKEKITLKLVDITGLGASVLLYWVLMNILPQGTELSVSARYTPSMLVSVALSAGLLYLVYLAKSSYAHSHDGQLLSPVHMKSFLRKSVAPYTIFVLVGVFMGILYVGGGVFFVPLAILFLFVIRFAFNRVAATDQYLLETIRVLSSIPEETGIVEEGRSKRLAELSLAIAQEMGLSPEDAKQVEYAALLHNIGAVAKGGPAGTEEPDLLESEGVVSGGFDILGQVKYLEVAAEILRGREGLRDRVVDADKRRAVSLGSGILRAVDDFESLVSGSDKREPLEKEAALTEMNLERGTIYDSQVLRAIARIYNRMPGEGQGSVVREGAGEEEPDFWKQ